MTPLLPRAAPRFRPDFSLATVNIVLLLLLYFLVAGDPVAESERTVVPPTTRNLPLEGLPRPLLVARSGGALELDGVPVTLPAVMDRVASGTLVRVNLLVSRDHPARALLDLAGRLAGAGAELRLITLRPSRRGGADP